MKVYKHDCLEPDCFEHVFDKSKLVLTGAFLIKRYHMIEHTLYHLYFNGMEIGYDFIFGRSIDIELTKEVYFQRGKPTEFMSLAI